MEHIERQPAQVVLRELANPMAVEWPGEPPLLRQAAATVAVTSALTAAAKRSRRDRHRIERRGRPDHQRLSSHATVPATRAG